MTVIKTPLNYDAPRDIELSDDGSGYMWKQIIPMDAEVAIKGKKFKFDRQYLAGVRDAFKKNALGTQTAFQLADDENNHDTEEDLDKDRNWDPERYRGEITDMKVVNKGLYGRYKLTADGMKLIKDNPKLGVSASLHNSYTSKADGKYYPVVMRHCLGTLNPKIKNQSPWTSDLITLSDTDLPENEEVYDLTMPTKEDDKKNVVEVDKDEWDRITKFVNDVMEAQEDDDVDDDNTDDSEDETEDETEDEPQTVKLSDTPEFRSVNARLRAADERAAMAEWKAKRTEYKRAGVPKVMLDLAEEVCSLPDEMVINLSDSEGKNKKVDTKANYYKMLDEAKGTVDLSEELGHVQPGDEDDDEGYKAIEHDFLEGEFSG